LQSEERPLREANGDFTRPKRTSPRSTSEFVEVESEAVDENGTAGEIDGVSIEEISRLQESDDDPARPSRRPRKHERPVARHEGRFALVTTTFPSRRRFLLDENDRFRRPRSFFPET
jgi:hypothetical protein